MRTLHLVDDKTKLGSFKGNSEGPSLIYQCARKFVSENNKIIGRVEWKKLEASAWNCSIK